MIEIKNLTKSFNGVNAVDDLSFTVSPGEVLGFLGPNGAGKSTTMKIISGFLSPTSGTVSVFGHDVEKEPLAVKQMMGYLPEGAPAYSDMTVKQFLSFIADARGLGKEKQARVEDVISKLELEGVQHQVIETLSKGFKRRVGIAQAIIHDPRVLILDEPTDGLDPNQKHQVRELIENLSRDKIVIVSTHILEEVTAVCTRAIIISGGKLLVDGSPTGLAQQSRYHGAVTLVSKRAFDDTEIESLRALEGVQDVESSEDFTYIVLPERGETIFPRVSDYLGTGNLDISEVYIDRGHLEDVFRDLTAGGAA